jgi:hypothetical protein
VHPVDSFGFLVEHVRDLGARQISQTSNPDSLRVCFPDRDGLLSFYFEHDLFCGAAH